MAIPFVMLKLDKPVKLRFGMGAVEEFQELTGIPLTQLDEELDIEKSLLALWVMLRQDMPDLSWKDACAYINDNAPDMATVISAASRAVSVAFRREKKSPSIAAYLRNLVSSRISRASTK